MSQGEAAPHGCGDAAVHLELPGLELVKRLLQGNPHGDNVEERDRSEGLEWIF